MKKIGSILVVLIFFGLISFSQNSDTIPYKFKSFTSFGAELILHNGIWMGTVPATPTERTVNIAGTPYYALGYGLNFNYHFIENLSFYFDINMYKRKIPVAYSGSYAQSDWVFEMTDYNSKLVGPFTEDAYYDVNTNGFRLGLKAYLQHKKPIQPWIGLYWGYYVVTHGIYTKDNKKTWGNNVDNVMGFSLYNLGVDFVDKSSGLGFTIFIEGGAPVDRNYKINDLINTGWTFTDYGEGEHIFGYYRIGISLNSLTFRKNKKQ